MGRVMSFKKNFKKLITCRKLVKLNFLKIDELEFLLAYFVLSGAGSGSIARLHLLHTNLTLVAHSSSLHYMWETSNTS